jgi:alpha-L-fucosidase
LEAPVEANTFMIQEFLPMGQRIKSFVLEILKEGHWVKAYEGSTIGNKRLVRFETQTIEGVRFTVKDSKAQVVVSNLGLFKAPELHED